MAAGALGYALALAGHPQEAHEIALQLAAHPRTWGRRRSR